MPLARRLTTALALGLAMGVAVRSAGAQARDSARASATSRSQRDSLRPPLTARQAFIYSAILPGYSQSVFGRHKTAALMLFVEAMSIAMIRESAADVREARRMRGDSLVLSYVDPQTGAAATTVVPRHFDAGYVRARESHVEDWIALLIANHLFSSAEAFVAANLWDVPAQLSVGATPSKGGATISAQLYW